MIFVETLVPKTFLDVVVDLSLVNEERRVAMVRRPGLAVVIAFLVPVPGGMVSMGRAVSGGHGDLQGAGAPGPRPITAVLSPTPLCPSYALY
jgi:hypothetical protein